MAAGRRAPVVVAVVVCLLPAIGFTGLWRWAAATDDRPSGTVAPTFQPEGPPDPELTTELASLRRVPGPVATRLTEQAAHDAEEAFRQGIEEVMEAASRVGERSCAAVALDGAPLAVSADDVTVTPASNQKLFVAVAALELVGPETTLVTEVRSAPPVDGVVGDLYLVGGGDPLLRSTAVPLERDLAIVAPTSFDALLDHVVAAGVTRVEGDVVADGGRYDDEFLVPSWGPDITRDDGGPIGALLVNDGRIFGSGVGLNPAQAAANELSRLLTARGVTVTGGNRTDAAPDDVEAIASVESASVGDLVAEMLVSSDNQIAEMLLKEIGHVAVGEGSRPAGMAAVRQLLAERGVDL
ncbi:MAG: D-alanyl-D-alanine carboxypeptidase, partial [Ilumatobacteraceae bacterium]